MIKSLWINLPVNDVQKSKDFFTQIGFSLNTQFGVRDDAVSFIIGESGITLMLFEKSLYEIFAGTKLANNPNSGEVLFSFDAESVEEVDEMAKKVVDAGGTLYGEPAYKDKWMYGCGFIDTDGQRWNVLYMDFSKMPLG